MGWPGWRYPRLDESEVGLANVRRTQVLSDCKSLFHVEGSSPEECMDLFIFAMRLASTEFSVNLHQVHVMVGLLVLDPRCFFVGCTTHPTTGENCRWSSFRSAPAKRYSNGPVQTFGRWTPGKLCRHPMVGRFRIMPFGAEFCRGGLMLVFAMNRLGLAGHLRSTYLARLAPGLFFLFLLSFFTCITA